MRRPSGSSVRWCREGRKSTTTEQLRPFRQAVHLVVPVPGIQQTVAAVVLSEIGLDMSRFPTVGHLISWAGLCPLQDESAGKMRSTKIRKGAPWIKTSLVQAAWAGMRTKGSYFGSMYTSVKNQRGSKNKAIIPVAASMLTSIYFMLQRGEPYRDLGADYRDRRDKRRTAQRLIRRVHALGFQVQVVSAAA